MVSSAKVQQLILRTDHGLGKGSIQPEKLLSEVSCPAEVLEMLFLFSFKLNFCPVSANDGRFSIYFENI